jgi:hypothetical protein
MGKTLSSYQSSYNRKSTVLRIETFCVFQTILKTALAHKLSDRATKDNGIITKIRT